MPTTAPAAVASREKRKTAGQRMSTLVGKALEDDDAFWGHETWAEDDSGNDSFRESDEDSDMRKDEFDSDFNDSETDDEDDEAAAGEAEELELQLEERNNRQRKSNYVDIAKGGRALMQKAKGSKGRGSKRAMGDGANAGLVLNCPPTMGLVMSDNLDSTPSQPLVTQNSQTATPPPFKKQTRKASDPVLRTTLASVRERRSQTRKRDTRNTAPTYSATPSQPHKKLKSSSTKKSKRRQYAQEELLLEAVHETEPSNLRWLLARKRVQDLADQDKDSLAALRDKHRGKNVIQRFRSRRGCLTTLTFPEMDSVPEILARPSAKLKMPQQSSCVITGKPARYRDPKTKMRYSDAVAFKELRRRHAAGEPLDQRKKPDVKPPVPKVEQKAALKPSNGGAPSSSGKPEVVNTNPQRPIAEESQSSQPASNQPTMQPPVPVQSGASAGAIASPLSPNGTRKSGRKWKPSEKMLQNIVNSPLKKDSMNQAMGDVQSSIVEKVAHAAIALAPPMPVMSSQASSTKEETNSETSTAVSKPGPNLSNKPLSDSTKSKVQDGAVPKAPENLESKATQDTATVPMPTSPRTVAHQQLKGNSAPDIEPGSDKEEGKVVAEKAVASPLKVGEPRANENDTTTEVGPKITDSTAPQRSAEVQVGEEQVYVIPADEDSGIKAPKYVTQSELILQAITDYSRHQGEESQVPNNASNGN